MEWKEENGISALAESAVVIVGRVQVGKRPRTPFSVLYVSSVVSVRVKTTPGPSMGEGGGSGAALCLLYCSQYYLKMHKQSFMKLN